MSIQIEKQLGDGRKVFEVYTKQEVDEILTQAQRLTQRAQKILSGGGGASGNSWLASDGNNITNVALGSALLFSGGNNINVTVSNGQVTIDSTTAFDLGDLGNVATSVDNLGVGDNLKALVWDGSVWAEDDIVNSFKGRTGAVLPASGDYAFSDLTGSIADGQVPESAITQHEGALNFGVTDSGASFLESIALDENLIFQAGDDISISSPATNTIRFDSTATFSLGDLTNVASAVDGLGVGDNRDVLYWNGSTWTNVALSTADIQSGTFADARIAESNVTQHGDGRYGELAVSNVWTQPNTFQQYLDMNSDGRIQGDGAGAIEVLADDGTNTGIMRVDRMIVNDLEVQGSIDNTNTNELHVEDQFISVNSGQTGTPTLDGGLYAERGDSSDAYWFWDEGNDDWGKKLGGLGTFDKAIFDSDIGSLVQDWNSDLDTYVANPLTSGELTQLQNIDLVTISSTQWTYLGTLDQNVSTTSDVEFNSIDINGSAFVNSNRDITSRQITVAGVNKWNSAELLVVNSNDTDLSLAIGQHGGSSTYLRIVPENTSGALFNNDLSFNFTDVRWEVDGDFHVLDDIDVGNTISMNGNEFVDSSRNVSARTLVLEGSGSSTSQLITHNRTDAGNYYFQRFRSQGTQLGIVRFNPTNQRINWFDDDFSHTIQFELPTGKISSDGDISAGGSLSVSNTLTINSQQLFTLGEEQALGTGDNVTFNTVTIGGTQVDSTDIGNFNTAFTERIDTITYDDPTQVFTFSRPSHGSGDITIDITHDLPSHSDVLSAITKTNNYFVFWDGVNGAWNSKIIDLAVTTGNIADGQVPQSAVTQHESALTITESQISDLGPYDNYQHWTISDAGGSTLFNLGPTDELRILEGTGISISLSAGTPNTLTITNTEPQLTTEQVEDIVGGMLDGTETLITVTYDDANGNIAFVVDNDLGNYDSTNLSITESQISDLSHYGSWTAEDGSTLADVASGDNVRFTGSGGMSVTVTDGNPILVDIDGSTAGGVETLGDLTNVTVSVDSLGAGDNGKVLTWSGSAWTEDIPFVPDSGGTFTGKVDVQTRLDIQGSGNTHFGFGGESNFISHVDTGYTRFRVYDESASSYTTALQINSDGSTTIPNANLKVGQSSTQRNSTLSVYNNEPDNSAEFGGGARAMFIASNSWGNSAMIGWNLYHNDTGSGNIFNHLYYNADAGGGSAGGVAIGVNNNGSGGFFVYTTPASTGAGTQATLTQRLNIPHSGDIVITPASNLDVNGGLEVSGSATFNGYVRVDNGNSLQIRETNGAYQRVDARVDATNFARAHWYGINDSGGTSNFRHAWYDGSAYIDVTASGGAVNFTGDLEVNGNTVWHEGNLTPVNGADDTTITGLWTFDHSLTAEKLRIESGGENPYMTFYDDDGGNGRLAFIQYIVGTGMKIASERGNMNFLTGTGGSEQDALTINTSQNSTFWGEVTLDATKDNTTSTGGNVYINPLSGLLQRSTSSRRYKKNIKDLTDFYSPIDTLNGLRSVRFKDKKSDNIHFGLIAEEVDEVFPEAVIYVDGKVDALDYQHITSLLIASTQEVDDEVTQLKNRVQELEEEVRQLTA